MQSQLPEGTMNASLLGKKEKKEENVHTHIRSGRAAGPAFSQKTESLQQY